jgi:mono/diheme cytochrome c family protein
VRVFAKQNVAAAAIAIMVVAPLAHAQDAGRGDPVKGKAAYLKARCDACHGTMGQGAPGPRLAPKPIAAAAFTSVVRKGKLANPRANRYWSGMPPYSPKFISDAELADIYAYMASIAESSSAGIPLLNDADGKR